MKRGKQKAIIGAGVIITVIWLVMAVLIVLFWSEKCPDVHGGSGWTELYFSCRPPNEIGDFLAGIFATLAFIWLMVAVFLQSMELAAQREELSLTRKELREQRKVMQAQVELIEEQTEIERSKDTAHFSMVNSAGSANSRSINITNAAADAFQVKIFSGTRCARQTVQIPEGRSLSCELPLEEYREFDIVVEFIDRRGRMWRQRFNKLENDDIESETPNLVSS